ncbi:MAG: hypothetical protein IJB14_07000, partial [Firmicutes bacterium]|nr:hypothetical protein [Bacillota bacterium]
MAKQIVHIAIILVVIVSGVYLGIHNNNIKAECEALYEKSHLTEENLKFETSFSATATDELDDKEGIRVKYKKLYGIAYIDTFKLEKEDGIEVRFLSGNPAKILILDGEGNERFYKEVSEVNFEPGKAGKYDVYLVGNKFTG